jgi:hypothetical protein
MAIYSANNPNKTLTIHRNRDCRHVPNTDLKVCGCGETGRAGKHKWMCEEHITLVQIDEFQNGRHWTAILCDDCFGQ